MNDRVRPVLHYYDEVNEPETFRCSSLAAVGFYRSSKIVELISPNVYILNHNQPSS